MNGAEIKIIVLVILIFFSAFFSASEMAFSSINRIRLRNAADDGNKKASAVLKLAERFDRLLSTVLVGNNVVNILSSSLATVLFIELFKGDNTKGTTVATVVMTVVVLIFGEIVPKSIAKGAPERFAMFVVSILRFFEIIFTPFTIILIGITSLFSKMFKSNNQDEDIITEDEILTFVEEAELEGGIDEQESELIRSAVEFNDREAQEILTHRVDIAAISDKATVDEANSVFVETGFSRLPVYTDTIDKIIGVIHHKDFCNKVLTGEGSISDIINATPLVHKSIKISDLLKLLQKEKTHIAVVADDYGGTLGIVTMEDIIEELVGEIWDEHDDVVEEIVELEENKYKILCNVALDRAFELFDIRDEGDETSVGGWVMSELDKIPEEGDSFTYKNVEVVVTKTDSSRVLEIVATVRPDNEEDEGKEKDRDRGEEEPDSNED